MVSEENTVDPMYVNTDPTHQEGIAHIKDKLYERNGAPTNIAPGGSGISEQQPGLIDTVKTYLGYGNSSGTSGSTGATTGTTTDGTTDNTGASTGTTDNTGADTIAPKTTEADKINQNVSQTANATDSATGAKSDPSDADQEDTKTSSNPSQHAAPKSADPKTMEHRDAIPTAGGVRLGEKHWGESDVVPDLPPKDSAGQPNAEVQSNTAKNTGSATVPATGEQQHSKPSVLDKIKDKLPGHNKE